MSCPRTCLLPRCGSLPIELCPWTELAARFRERFEMELMRRRSRLVDPWAYSIMGDAEFEDVT